MDGFIPQGGLALLPVIAGAGLAYANGANDNFKGVATLYGSGVLSFRVALATATVATWIGSVAALLLAGELVGAFSGKGLVSAQVLTDPAFGVSVALGAAFTVLLATRLGLPISTTHALVGGLVGGGLATQALQAERLLTTFLLPLALSPLMAATLAGVGYLALRQVRVALGLVEDDCICIEPAQPATASAGAMAMTSVGAPTLRIGSAEQCGTAAGSGGPMAIASLRALDLGHIASGLMVSFGRGLNDTPKIAGVLLIGTVVGGTVAQGTIVGVATAMAIGGLLSARRVAKTMSWDITGMNEGQGFAANLVTSLLVLGASNVGVPVSTTHVSCGALFGIGAASGEGRWHTIATIIGAWVVTLPVAAASAAVLYLLLT